MPQFLTQVPLRSTQVQLQLAQSCSGLLRLKHQLLGSKDQNGNSPFRDSGGSYPELNLSPVAAFVPCVSKLSVGLNFSVALPLLSPERDIQTVLNIEHASPNAK